MRRGKVLAILITWLAVLSPPPARADLLESKGRITFLRVHDVGTGFGPPTDFLDVEVVVQLDSQAGKSFGFQLRADNQEDARNGMLDTLRSAFRANRTVLIDYFRTGIHNGRIIRVAKTN